MLSKVNRLPSFEFRRIQKKGSRIIFRNLNLIWLENQLPVSRFGFVVGLNFSKLATRRNKAKRLLREAVRRNLAKIRSGQDIILSLRGSNDLTQENIEEIVLATFAKAQLL